MSGWMWTSVILNCKSNVCFQKEPTFKVSMKWKFHPMRVVDLIVNYSFYFRVSPTHLTIQSTRSPCPTLCLFDNTLHSDVRHNTEEKILVKGSISKTK